jgi:hypothetical protein
VQHLHSAVEQVLVDVLGLRRRREQQQDVQRQGT